MGRESGVSWGERVSYVRLLVSVWVKMQCLDAVLATSLSPAKSATRH